MIFCLCCVGEWCMLLYMVKGYVYVVCSDCGFGCFDLFLFDELVELYGDCYFVGGEDCGGYVDYDVDVGLHCCNAAVWFWFLVVLLFVGWFVDVVDVGCVLGYVFDVYWDVGLYLYGVDVLLWVWGCVVECGYDVYVMLMVVLIVLFDLVLVSFF